MLKITQKGKELVERNGGILKIQSLETSGNFDYSQYGTWEEVYDAWADEVGGWNYYEGECNPESGFPFTAEEARTRLERDFDKAAVEMTIDECVENGDKYGLARKFGYLTEIEEE